MNTITLAIGAVAVTLLTAVVGIIYLAAGQQPIPDVLQNVAVGSLTGLVGLLVDTRRAVGEHRA